MQRGITSIVTIATVSIGLLWPTIATAKKAAPPANPAVIHGKVLHGEHGQSAKVWINPLNHRKPLHRPAVSVNGFFTATLKPGTYVIHGQHRSLKGHLTIHLDAGQAIDLALPLSAPAHVWHVHEAYRLGVKHVPVVPATVPPAPKKLTIKQP